MASNSAQRSLASQNRTEKHGISHSKSVNPAHSIRTKGPTPRRSVTPNSRSSSMDDDDQDPQRVRVAVRLRPRNAEEIQLDVDFADCVELQPEMKRLKLRKNNWSSESYRFDEVFTETASQKRVYEAVAKPVVEGVLNGYNGTVMAYGQTGTGKTHTLGRLGKDDTSERGIMVRSVEDIISNISLSSDTVEVSYLQLYMESVQDLLAPEKNNISIHEDPKTGEVSLPGAEVVKVRGLDNFLELLQVGEANRHAANTKLNAESSRSHAILIIYIQRSVHGKIENIASQERDSRTDLCDGNARPKVRKSKLLIVDLAGSERIDKSGSEGNMLEEAKFINLSLTSLGKCINALAENSPHIPTRDSKLTRLLRDSFGGTARTSLIVTIGPSARYHAETASTIMFGQRAMKIVNMVKLKEEVDYESLCRKLENQIDFLSAEMERQQKFMDNEKHQLEMKLEECQGTLKETEKNLLTRSEFLENENSRLEAEMINILDELKHQKDLNNLMNDKVTFLETSLKQSKQHQLENSTYQKVLADTTHMYEKKIAKLTKQIEDNHSRAEVAEEELNEIKMLLNDRQKSIEQHEMEDSSYKKALTKTTEMYEKNVAELIKQIQGEHAQLKYADEQLGLAKRLLNDHQNSMQEEVAELRKKLQDILHLNESMAHELKSLKSQYQDLLVEKVTLNEELQHVRKQLSMEVNLRKAAENDLLKLKKNVPETWKDHKDSGSYLMENVLKESSEPGTPKRTDKSKPVAVSGQRSTIAKLCEEVGLHKILQLLTSEDSDIQIHAVKVVANLAAEDINQERIVEEGGLDALLNLLKLSENTTILRVASGAIANLAMNEMNQILIMSKGGARLLAKTALKTEDLQTLRMVAGALANLCGNEKLHMMLKEDGGIKALLEMARSGSKDVVAQVARGFANFAKCETRGIAQGQRRGPSLLLEEGVLSWLISNSNTTCTSTRRHIELALCHLAQNADNAKEFMSTGGVKVLLRISIESNRDDIRNLAKKTLRMNQTFQAEITTG